MSAIEKGPIPATSPGRRRRALPYPLNLFHQAPGSLLQDQPNANVAGQARANFVGLLRKSELKCMAMPDGYIPRFKAYKEGEPIPPVDPEDLRRRWNIKAGDGEASIAASIQDRDSAAAIVHRRG